MTEQDNVVQLVVPDVPVAIDGFLPDDQLGDLRNPQLVDSLLRWKGNADKGDEDESYMVRRSIWKLYGSLIIEGATAAREGTKSLDVSAADLTRIFFMEIKRLVSMDKYEGAQKLRDSGRWKEVMGLFLDACGAREVDDNGIKGLDKKRSTREGLRLALNRRLFNKLDFIVENPGSHVMEAFLVKSESWAGWNRKVVSTPDVNVATHRFNFTQTEDTLKKCASVLNKTLARFIPQDLKERSAAETMLTEAKSIATSSMAFVDALEEFVASKTEDGAEGEVEPEAAATA